MKYTHAGVDIEFVEANGVFRATVGGERVTAPSLTGIKTKIDKAGKFPQFVGIVDRGRYSGPNKADRFKEVVIVGTKRAKANSFRGTDLWITSTGEHVSEVFQNTPKSVALLEAYDDMVTTHMKEKDEMDVRHRAERAKAKAALLRHPLPTAK